MQKLNHKNFIINTTDIKLEEPTHTHKTHHTNKQSPSANTHTLK